MEMQDDYAAAQSAKMAALVFENCKAGQADDWLEPYDRTIRDGRLYVASLGSYVGLLATAMKSCDKSKGKQDELRWIIYAFVMMLWYSSNALVAVLDKHNLTLDVLSAIIQVGMRAKFEPELGLLWMCRCSGRWLATIP